MSPSSASGGAAPDRGFGCARLRAGGGFRNSRSNDTSSDEASSNSNIAPFVVLSADGCFTSCIASCKPTPPDYRPQKQMKTRHGGEYDVNCLLAVGPQGC